MKETNGKMPKHVVVVPDGNRRWARERGYLPWRGHFVGAERAKELLEAALELGIFSFSLWGGSWNNLTKRPKREINALFKIYEIYFKQLAKREELHRHRVKVSIIGRWDEVLPKSGVKAARDLIEMTKGYDKRLLNFFIAYNGTDEMIAAIKEIVKEGQKNKKLRVTPKALEKHLWSGHLPPVDLLVRTGSSDDPHNSVGFMMWQTANSQLYFTNTRFPDFGKKEFIKAIRDYQRRERRLGK